MRSRNRKLLAAAAAAFGLFGAAPSPARADGGDDLAQRMVELEAQVRELDITLKSEGPNAESVERRIIDGQVLYELKNYEAASIILLDVVDRYRNDRSWPDALFYLADSLYLKRDFLSSRRYFEQGVALGPSGRHYQDSLERLIELSLHTGDYANVDEYVTKLGGLGKDSPPNVSYVEGKYLFFRGRYADASARLSVIEKGQPYWFQAQYFLGAIQVAQHKPGDAVQIYDGLAKTEAKSDAEKRVIELTHMALGRLYYDQSQSDAAALEYSKITQGSDLFTDALYEGAWLAIKDKQYAKAYRSLDLLLTIVPDGQQAPDIKLLMSNLQVRQSLWDEATRSFSSTRDDFEGVKKEVDEALRKQGNSVAYFRELLAKNVGKFDLANYVPASATKWLAREPDMDTLSGLIGDESDLKQSLEESAELVVKLEKAIEGPARVNIFPELAAARTRALATGNRLIDLENQLIQREHDLVARSGSSEEQRDLAQATGARQQLERQMASMPKASDSYNERIRNARADYDQLDKRAVELNVLLANLRAERIAIEKFVADTHQVDEPGVRAQFVRQIAELRSAEEEMTRASEQLRREIAESAQSVGVDDAQMQAEAQVKKQLMAAQQVEEAALARLRDRVNGADRGKADQVEALLTRARSAQSTIDQFNARIDGLIDEKLTDMRVTIAEEKKHIGDYEHLLGSYRGETNDVGGGVTADSFKNIAERFYQIVVRADVGIIDVAWAQKQGKTDENARLVREKKRELKLLDDEFKEVLKE